jgi:hypothetical protein
MDSNSDSDSSVRSTNTAAFRSSPAIPNHNDPQYERGLVGEQFVVDHTANFILRVKVSGIWHHGGERRRTIDSFNSRVDGKVIGNSNALTAVEILSRRLRSVMEDSRCYCRNKAMAVPIG